MHALNECDARVMMARMKTISRKMQNFFA